MKEVNIYLAGKIEPNGWRQSIIDIRNNFFDHEYRSVNKLKNARVHIDKIDDSNMYVTGPFFLSCDHSCWHGAEDHGLGINNRGCQAGGVGGFEQFEVVDICKTQIKRADIIIAFINDDTCFGTLFELGLAKQMGKKIVTIFDTKERKRKMWFIAENSDFTISLFDDYSIDIFNKFERPDVAEAIYDIMDLLKKWYINDEYNKQHKI